MIKITTTIKNLILEILTGEGPGHIKEVHLQVVEFRPNVPQHTIRARLSEMSRSDNLEEKLSAFGNGFYGLYEETKHLCSVVSYPDRGPWGDARYRGNCTGYIVKDLILRFKCQSVFDPAEGSGTVSASCLATCGTDETNLKSNSNCIGKDITHSTFLPPFPRPGFASQDFRQLFVVRGTIRALNSASRHLSLQNT